MAAVVASLCVRITGAEGGVSAGVGRVAGGLPLRQPHGLPGDLARP